jgi:hypothetical protein
LNVVPKDGSRISEEDRSKLELQKRKALILALEKSTKPSEEGAGGIRNSEPRSEGLSASSELITALKDQDLSSLITVELAALDMKEDATAEEYNQAAAKQRRNVLRVTLMSKGVQQEGAGIQVRSYLVEFETDIKNLSSESEVSSAKVISVKRLKDEVAVPV